MLNKDEQIKLLTEHNEELENYFRNTIIPQLFVDADLVLRKFTPPAMKQFNLHDGDVGTNIEDIQENFRFPEMLDAIREVITSSNILEKEIQTTDSRWYQMNVIPYITLQDNKVNGVIITFVEITQRIEDLKEQEKLIADHEILLDTISHDIKNPLTTLVMAVQLFKKTTPDNVQQFQNLLQKVDNALTKMHTVITDLTEVRKQEHKYKAEREQLNFEQILEDVRLTLYDSIVMADAVITSDIDVPVITFSKRKLRSIVYNLMNNALKFKSPDRNPVIEVSTKREEEHIVISVKDNGIGIDHDKQEAIFSKYYRLENAIEGSGIGLYLVKEIVHNSGGKVVVKSQPGKGTEFKVYMKSE